MTKAIKAWDRLSIARMIDRPNAEDYIKLIFDNFFELHGDRYYGDDKAIIGGIGKLENTPVTIIGIQKGKNLKENMERNFGSPYPEGYRKALRLILLEPTAELKLKKEVKEKPLQEIFLKFHKSKHLLFLLLLVKVEVVVPLH